MFEPSRLRCHELWKGAHRKGAYRKGAIRNTITIILLVALAGPAPAIADTARFDLAGPKIDVHVTRAGVTLPIASVPNLQPGDRLWLHPNLPNSQSVHYLMVLVFLRGTTNPPPDNWFTRIQTWDKSVREEGIEVTVPAEAEQAVLFLAPTTGGDFGTLRSAVQGRPGVFVRASQDLNQAGFEQARIEKYIASMRQVPALETADPSALQKHSSLIAGTLALKPNADCVKLPPDQQYTCLTQSGNQDLLDDGHGQSLVAALSNGAGSDFINQASTVSVVGGGAYSPYVGALVDLVHIMSSLHTAQYQYIPAVAFPQQQSLNLRLNAAPSFHNPKSVIVIGLPAIQPTSPPPLRPSNPSLVSCLLKPGVVMPVEGAPLVFSTGFAHDLVLHLNYPAASRPVAAKSVAAQPQDIPLTPDPYNGGLALAVIPKRRALAAFKVALPTLPPGSDATTNQGTAQPSAPSTPAQSTADSTSPIGTTGLTGTIQGFWGFDPFTGPTMPFQNIPGKDWKLTGDAPLIAGKDHDVLITSTGVACIQSITLDPAPPNPEKQKWKAASDPHTAEVALKLSSLPGHDPGTLHLTIRQFGATRPDTLSLVSYSQPAKLATLEFRATDKYVLLTGTSLDEVREVDFGGATFTPAPGTSGSSVTQPDGRPGLRLTLPPGAPSPPLPVGEKLYAQVTLKDGHTVALVTTVGPARPTLTLIGRAAVPPDPAANPNAKPTLEIKLVSPTNLAIVDTLLFSLKSLLPFPRAGQIEIANMDESLHATLTIAAQTLVLEDPYTILARFDPLKTFGESAFGPLRFRAIAPDGAAGEWLPLVTLVRRPTLTGLTCLAEGSRETPATPCSLAGTGLYLIDSIATDAEFTKPIRVPEGFVGSSLPVPAPTSAVYYLRLRDDPVPANTIALPSGPL